MVLSCRRGNHGGFDGIWVGESRTPFAGTPTAGLPTKRNWMIVFFAKDHLPFLNLLEPFKGRQPHRLDSNHREKQGNRRQLRSRMNLCEVTRPDNSTGVWVTRWVVVMGEGVTTLPTTSNIQGSTLSIHRGASRTRTKCLLSKSSNSQQKTSSDSGI